ncbi:pyocin knob domain-containing protein, partial [Paenibacillus sp. oral taxon 786]|uniref:pyocin knob domain-containing protein n=1 Tax=Paenibacillus sp. oral taxon 786 TaxID=652715 RepID=UPI00055B86B4
SGTNLDNVKSGGFYNGNGLINTPEASKYAAGSGWWYLTVQVHSSDPNNWIKQTIKEFGTNKVWERTLMAGTWSSWVLINPHTPTQVLYVDAVNGNDSNTGKYGSPFKTINRAIKMLQESPIILPWGVTIRLAPGTYNESIFISEISGHSISIEADGGKGGNKSNVILNGIVGISQSSLHELKFTNVTFALLFDVREAGASFISFSSCIFNAAGGAGANLYGAIVGGNAKYYFTGCTFTGLQTAINAMNGSWVFLSSNNNGSGNTTGIWAEGGSIVTVSGVVSLGASTAFKVTEGAQIFNTPNGAIRTT